MARSWFSINRYTVISLILCVMASGTHIANAADYRPWTGEFMRMGAGARALGMGNAYTAVPGDIYSAYFNPAGLSSMNARQLSISLRYLSMDRHFKDVIFGGPIGPDASFALSWINAGTDEIIGRDLNGNATGTLNDTRNAFGVTFSKRLNRMVSLGLNVKYALWKLAGDDATSFGFDAGIMVEPIDRLTASFVLRDINSRFSWKSTRWEKYVGSLDGQSLEKDDEFPVYYTIGAAYRLFADRLLLAATLEFLEDNPMGTDLGVQYAYNDTFSFRTGIYNYNSDDALDYGSFSAGFTLQATGRIGVDYAYATDVIDDDSIHSLTLVMTYGAE